MAKFASGKPGPIKGILPTIAGRAELTERQDGREGFRCPEYRLPVERLLRISGEKTTPIYAGMSEASHWIAQRLSDSRNLARILCHDGAIPKQYRPLLPLQSLHNFALISNQQLT
jgi:hypothetical protein